MNATIRAAGAGDAVAIAGLIREMAATFGESSPVEPAWVEAFLARDDAGAFVADDGDAAVGVVTWFLFPGLYHAAHCATVDEAIVTAGHRGRGIGTALLRRTMAHLEGLGVAEIGISTGLENEGAQRLYRRLGFTDASLLLERHL
ncbi:MAG: GNAT family N-acetyltransferase [Thermoleophilia bacterium]|nr:GNAT family N-acetyltransferase [Thermoleophilia bacterium]